MKNFEGYLIPFCVIAVILIIIFKSCSSVNLAVKTWRQEMNQLHKDMEEAQETRKDPPNIEQVLIDPEQTYTLEPITLKVLGRKLEHKYAHWEIVPYAETEAEEDEFNEIETKYVFTCPGTYKINSQNQWFQEISASEPGRRQISKYVYVRQREKSEDSEIPCVIVDFPEYWVDEDSEFIINASRSYTPNGILDSYFIQFGDGNYREGKIDDANDLIFHHIYSSESVLVDNSSVTSPHYFTLVLYGDKGGANFFSDVIYVLSDYSKKNGFLESANSRITPEEYFDKYLKKTRNK